MTYNFFTVEPLRASQISDTLAACLCVDVSVIDVADVDGDQENRNWDALALCDYSYVHGDVSLSLDIFVQETVSDQPTEAELARKFAKVAQALVLYPAEERIPSAYWLVDPAGLVTRARLVASDDERPAYSIDAVEAAVPQLPGVRAIQLPEIVREQHVPTPTAADFSLAVDSFREARPDPVDPALMDEPGSPLYESRIFLAQWERMVRRMESGWRPAGRYPAELYWEDLRARDQIAQLSVKLSKPVADLLHKSVDRIDEEFKKCTEPDDTWLAEAGAQESVAYMKEGGWWWHRKPHILPWEKN